MSRASEITLFIILVQASIGFIDTSGVFTNHYLDVTSNNASYTITDLESYSTATAENNGINSQIDLYLNWAWESFFIGIKVLFAVVFILPTLINIFGVPTILATFMQVGVYYVYATWYAQYKSGKGWKLYE